MSRSEDDFKFVHRKKRKNYKIRNAIAVAGRNIESDIDVEALKRRLESVRQEITISAFYKISLESLNTCLNSASLGRIDKLICFGIGSFGTCLIALHQLAFILEIIRKLDVVEVVFYDPVLSSAEKEILKELGCDFLERNCEGKYAVECPTLFYLPHCPKQLTNNLLWSNWQPESMRKLILIGNSFENMRRNTPERFLKQDAEYVLRASQCVTEVPLINNFKFEDIFNDTAIHVFRSEDLSALGDEFWSKNPEPLYGDVELITEELERKLNIISKQ